MWPGAESAARPRPVNSEEPQWARGSWCRIRGATARVYPVQASKAVLWDTIQSVAPSKCSTENVVVGDLVDIIAVSGVVEVMR